MGAAILVLALAVGALWAQVQTLNQDLARQLSYDEEYTLCTGRDLFQTARCRLIGTDSLFSIEADVKLANNSFTVKGIQVEENPAPRAPIPESIFLALPDPRFEC